MSALEDGRLPDGTGLSQAEPKVSALRASIPDAELILKARLAVLQRGHDNAKQRMDENPNGFAMAIDASIMCALFVVIEATKAEIRAAQGIEARQRRDRNGLDPKDESPVGGSRCAPTDAS